MGYYTPSNNKFLVPYSNLEFVEISAQGTSHTWKPTGQDADGNYVGGNPVTGRANDSSRGASSIIVNAKNLNTLADIKVSGSGEEISYVAMAADQSSFFGDADSYHAGTNVVQIQTSSFASESNDRQYGGQVVLDVPDEEHVANVTDVKLIDNDGQQFIAKNAIEIAKTPVVDPNIAGSISDTVIKDGSTIEITGKNLYYADFVDGGNVLEAVFHSSPIDNCTKIFFELESGIRLGDENWKMVFKTLPIDQNIVTGVRRGENKLVYLLNNGVSTIQISGNFRYLHEPEISGYNPRTGVWGEEILVSGSEFYGITGVKVGEKNVENFSVYPDTGITFNLPNETKTDHIQIFGSGGTTSTEDIYGKYGTQEISYNNCTHQHGSCVRSGVGVDEFENYYAAAYTLETKDGWEGSYGTAISPFNVGYKSGTYKLKFNARQGRLVNTLYSGYDVSGTSIVTGKEILEGRNCSWMWAIIKNVTGHSSGNNTYTLGEGNSWKTTGELKFHSSHISGEVLASGHANGFGYMAGHTGIKDFRDMTMNPVKNWSQIWGADKTNRDYLPYEVTLTGINAQDNLSLWIRGHSSKPSDYQKNQLDSITGISGVDLRLSDKVSFENYLAQIIEFEQAPICPLPPEKTLGNSGVQWLPDNDVPNVVYLSCYNINHVYSGEHYNSLKSSVGKIEVREPNIEIVDFNPKEASEGEKLVVSGKSLHNVSDIRLSGKNGNIITLSKSYEISGLSQFTGHATTGISFGIPLDVQPYKTFTVVQTSGLEDLQSDTSDLPLNVVRTGLNSLGPITGKYEDVVNISGTYLNNVDFYFEGYTPANETQNYVRSLDTTLVSGTGAYVKIPKEIISANIYVSGENLFKESDQYFCVLPTISGMDKDVYYVGDKFRITGVNCTERHPFIAITGYNKVSQKDSLEFMFTLDKASELEYQAIYSTGVSNLNAPIDTYQNLNSVEQSRIGYYGVDESSLTGNYPESIKTGYSVITGTITPIFLGTGEPFLLSKKVGQTRSTSMISTNLSGLRSSVSESLIHKAPAIVVSGRQPVISGINPSDGAPSVPITISGSNFLNVTGVKFSDAAAGLSCHVSPSGQYGVFISGLNLNDLYGDPYEDQVHSIDIFPCDWGSTTGEIILLDHEHNN